MDQKIVMFLHRHLANGVVDAFVHVIEQLERHGMVALGEQRSMDTEASRRVYELAA